MAHAHKVNIKKWPSHAMTEGNNFLMNANRQLVKYCNLIIKKKTLVGSLTIRYMLELPFQIALCK